MNRIALIIVAGAMLLAACKKEVFLQNADPGGDGPPPGQDGAACTSDRRCEGGLCISFGEGWTGGYCTTLDCKGGSCNGDDSACVSFLDGSSYCLDGCDQNADCRNGYRCRTLDASGSKVCYRDIGDGPLAGSIGSDCIADNDCIGDMTCDKAVPGGYCLYGSCDGCPSDGTCEAFNGTDRCIAACDATRDCRTGYVCEGGACLPGEPIVPPFGFDVTEDVLDITCGGENLGPEDFGTRWRMTYEIPAGSTGYALVPFVKTGALRPIEIGLPSGGKIDLLSDYKHHNIRITEFQFFDQESDGTYGEVALDWPIVVPFAPQRAALMETGAHTVDVITSIDEPCVYALATDGTGTVVDLNIIFMGLEGYSAAMAPNDADLRAVFARVNTILEPSGIGLGDVKYFDAPRELAERYAHVRDDVEMRRATSFGAPRGPSRAGHLNVDMFLVEDLRLGGGSLVLGLSAGLPGPPGLHGNPANGLVFTGTDIGSDNDFVAHIMAHELGHYLGLRHTTEQSHNRESGVVLNFYLGTTDPIEDTPECMFVDANAATCPDATNLMFPFAPSEIFTPIITPGQTAALKANPLLRPAP